MRPPLDSAALHQAVVRPGGLWTTLTVLPETGSTNADLAGAARAGTPEGAVLAADHQRAGRGRAGRAWTAPPRSGLAVSMLFRPGAARAATATPRGVAAATAAGGSGWAAVPAGRWGWLPLLVGVAAAERLTRLTGLPATLKWPNDLLVGGGKVAGFLAEVVAGAVVVGVGLNVTQRGGELPPRPPGAPAATSLALAGARTTDRAGLLVGLLAGVEEWYRRWREAGGDPARSGLRDAYLAASATVGRPVRAVLPGGGELTGTAETVDGDGRLVVAGRPLSAGDIVHIRSRLD